MIIQEVPFEMLSVVRRLFSRELTSSRVPLVVVVVMHHPVCLGPKFRKIYFVLFHDIPVQNFLILCTRLF